ncbi:MAG: nucleotide exchange factor GrpE [Candidatus Latescibacterota bacterium]
MLARPLDLLEEHGVERIPSPGKPFDSAANQAVIVQNGEMLPEGGVAELETGHRFRERLVRPSWVCVVR